VPIAAEEARAEAKAQQESEEKVIDAGDRVVVLGLTSKSGLPLNGQKGWVVRLPTLVADRWGPPSERYAVSLERAPQAQPSLFKAANLLLDRSLSSDSFSSDDGSP